MEKARLSGQTILIVQDKLDSAIPLQDRIVGDGGRVLTAYSLPRALLLAESADLSGAVIDLGMTGAEQIIDLLESRKIPVALGSGQRPRSEHTKNAELRSSEPDPLSA